MNDMELVQKVADGLRDLNAWQLSGRADCASPDSFESAGALFLTSVLDGVLELITWGATRWVEAVESDDVPSLNDDGEVSQIADDAPDIYTHRMWAEFVDLSAYLEDPTEYGVDRSDMEQSARVCLYMIAERLAFVLMDEAKIMTEELLAEREEVDA
jgi:hypothetical protein